MSEKKPSDLRTRCREIAAGDLKLARVIEQTALAFARDACEIVACANPLLRERAAWEHVVSTAVSNAAKGDI